MCLLKIKFDFIYFYFDFILFYSLFYEFLFYFKFISNMCMYSSDEVVSCMCILRVCAVCVQEG